MENTEIPQQEKRGIFKTANLKTIVPKTPEEKERVEKIKEQIIDLEIPDRLEVGLTIYDQNRLSLTISNTSIAGIITRPFSSTVVQKRSGSVVFSPDQIAQVTTNRLNKLFHNTPCSHLVPLYDHLGNVLWPEKIPYEEVQKMVETKTKLP